MLEKQTQQALERSPELRKKVANLWPPRAPNLLEVLEAQPEEVERAYAQLHSIYAAGIHELARQSSAHCAERGQLLINLWSSSEALRERMSKLHKARADAAIEMQAQLDEQLVDARDKIRHLESLQASQRSSSDELQKAAQAREKLIAMIRTLQSALTSVEEQLAASQAGRLAAEAQLTTWLPHVLEYSSAAALAALEAQQRTTATSEQRTKAISAISAGKKATPAFSRSETAGMTATRHTAADGTGAVASADAVLRRAVELRGLVQSEAARLGDWEKLPMLPEQAPIDATAMRLLMTDMERIMGAIACVSVTASPSAVTSASGVSGASAVPADTALSPDVRSSYEKTIADLEKQLVQARETERQLRSRLEGLSARGAHDGAGPQMVEGTDSRQMMPGIV